jgi:hypothetical protein
MVTLGDLAALSRAEFDDVDNLGRTTLASLPALVNDFLDATGRAAALVDEGLLECFHALLDDLDPGERLIATRRAGLGGESMTLQELGDELGVSRERVRQVEARLCKRLAHQPWAREARLRIAAAAAAGPVPLATLANDRWWAAASEQPEMVAFVVSSVLDLEMRVIELDEQPWLSGQDATTINAAMATLFAGAAKVTLPAPLEVFDALASQAGAPFGPHVSLYLRDELRGRLQLRRGRAGPRARVRRYPRRRAAGDAPRLADAGPDRRPPASARPSTRQAAGRGHALRPRGRRAPPPLPRLRGLADGAGAGGGGAHRVHSARTTVALRRDPRRAARDHRGARLDDPVRPGGADQGTPRRRCATSGRLRVVLPNRPDSERRVYVHDAIEDLLKKAGEPMLRADLVASLDAQMGISAHGLIALQRPQFVRVDLDRVGLLSRDVPGGAAAITEACAHLEAVLARRGRGLSELHAHQELIGLSTIYRDWSVPLTMSVLRADGRFRLSMSGAVGLKAWDSTRVPTRLELVRSALAEGRRPRLGGGSPRAYRSALRRPSATGSVALSRDQCSRERRWRVAHAEGAIRDGGVAESADGPQVKMIWAPSARS